MKHQLLRGEAALTIVGSHAVLALPAPSPGPEAGKQRLLLRGQSQQRGNDPEAHGCVAYLASSGRGPLRRRRGASAAAGPTKRRKGLREDALETHPRSRNKSNLLTMPESPPCPSWVWPPISGPDLLTLAFPQTRRVFSLLQTSGGPARFLSLPLPSPQLFIPPMPTFPG